MKCLKCAGPMIEKQDSGVSVDYCPSCAAFWFDRGELESMFAAQYGDRIKEVPRDTHFILYSQPIDSPCPRCDTLSVRSGVLKSAPFLACSTCKGVFLTTNSLSALAVGHPPSTRLFEAGRIEPIESLVDLLLYGLTGALLVHMWRRIDETIGEEIH